MIGWSQAEPLSSSQGPFGNSDESKSQGGRAASIGGGALGPCRASPSAQAAPTTSNGPGPHASSSHCEPRVYAQELNPAEWRVVVVYSLSRGRLFATPWTVARQARLTLRFPRQDYWSGLQFPSPGELPDPGIEPASPELAGGFFTTKPTGKPLERCIK